MKTISILAWSLIGTWLLYLELDTAIFMWVVLTHIVLSVMSSALDRETAESARLRKRLLRQMD